MNSASSAVENGMNTTASRNTRWIHVSRWSLRAKKLSWVCWPAQKMPSVKELIRYVSRCGPNGTSAFQTVASDARAPGAQIGCCECVAMPTFGVTMLSTSNVIATAKIPSLSAARRPRFCPEKCWYRRTSYAGSAAPGADWPSENPVATSPVKASISSSAARDISLQSKMPPLLR